MSAAPDLDWDHVRIFLAVMRSTSLREAAEKLGVSHPTIRRRLEALEGELGLHLFDRRNDGLHATTEAAELLELAEEVERSVHALGRRALDADPELRGPLRVTAPEVVVTDLLMPDFAAFMERWPQIELQVETDYAVADLGSREADVAIRAMPQGKTPVGDVAGRRAASIWVAVYGRGDQWIGWRGEEHDRSWIAETDFPDLPVRGRLNDPLLQRAACLAGMGLTMLPCYLADPYLERRSEPRRSYDLWVLVHEDLRRSPRLRVFRDEIVDALRRLQPRLEGKV
jgi:DNA-binding transcriptional LysR family regulator